MNRGEIRRRARDFSEEWKDAHSESAERQSFWNAFYEVFGLSRRHVAVYEQAAQRASTGGQGWIDMLQPGEMGVEHKSRGENLNDAMRQLEDYLPQLKATDVPWLLVACDFARFKWKNLETGEEGDFALGELIDNLDLFWWIAGGDTPMEAGLPEVDVNLQATELLASLHDELRDSGYPDHDMREWLTRILFCLFADDTEVWDRKLFETYIESNTRDDGSDLGSQIHHIFQVLNTPESERSERLHEDLLALTYVNGDLFKNTLRVPACNEAVRDALRRASRYNWSKVSPAIFGSLFQNVMQPAERRQIGAHYTTEENILRTIRPLFLDELEAELSRAKTRPALQRFHDKLASLTFFDPACGCGNFLVTAYREIRRLETETLRRLTARSGETAGQRAVSLEFLCKVRVDQFYGIEIEEFPALIARTALYLGDHLANRDVSAEFGEHYVRFPIPASPHITIGNALRIDWGQVLPAEQADFVFGNPPFVGYYLRTKEQTADMALVASAVGMPIRTDYVAAWYAKSALYAAKGSPTFAYVSTNSLSQGQQVGDVWRPLLARGAVINFAHRTFEWQSEARGRAHVHVVIVGFSFGAPPRAAQLFEYANLRADPTVRTVSRINPYLAEGRDILVDKKKDSISVGWPSARFGSKPTDGGGLIIGPDEVADFRKDPVASKFLRRFMGATELLSSAERWCLWLEDASPSDMRQSLLVRRRLAQVRDNRLKSTKAATRSLASTPARFEVNNQPKSSFLAFPQTSSERRRIIPAEFLDADVIVNNGVIIVPDATLLHFGVLQSAMFDAWLRTVSGRLKSDIQLSPRVVFNTFPIPSLNKDAVKRIERSSQAVLDVRARYGGSSLDDLYDALAMPADLSKAHEELDRQVDRAFGGRRKLGTPALRLALLFELYEQQTAPLTAGMAEGSKGPATTSPKTTA